MNEYTTIVFENDILSFQRQQLSDVVAIAVAGNFGVFVDVVVVLSLQNNFIVVVVL